MNDTGKKYIIFGCDLFLSKGGVSDYTDNFAKKLNENNILKYVVTPYGRLGDSVYEIKKIPIPLFRGKFLFDKVIVLSKIITLLYYLNFYFRCYIELRKLKAENATIIFTEYYTDKFDILIYITSLLKIKYQIVLHGLDIITAKEKKFIHFDNNIKNAELIIFNSKATKELYNTTFSIQYNDSFILYPGIDLSYIDKNFLSNTADTVIIRKVPEEIVFSTVSYFRKRKGIDRAIKIVYNLHKKNPNIKYYIAGDGIEKENLKLLVKSLNAGEFIKFLGNIDDLTKYQLLKQSDVFILPNYSVNNSDFEGFGISFIEASLCHNLVIGGNHGGVKEAVLNNITGYLLDFDDEECIDRNAVFIEKCLMDKKQCDEIKNAGVKYVKDNYDWSVLINKFIMHNSQRHVTS